MSNSVGEGIASLGFVLLTGGGIVLVMELFARHERELNVFFNSLDPNLTVIQWSSVCIVCGLLLVTVGAGIDIYAQQKRGGS